MSGVFYQIFNIFLVLDTVTVLPGPGSKSAWIRIRIKNFQIRIRIRNTGFFGTTQPKCKCILNRLVFSHKYQFSNTMLRYVLFYLDVHQFCEAQVILLQLCSIFCSTPALNIKKFKLFIEIFFLKTMFSEISNW